MDSTQNDTSLQLGRLTSRQSASSGDGRVSGGFPPGWWLLPGILLGVAAWAVILSAVWGLVQ